MKKNLLLLQWLIPVALWAFSAVAFCQGTQRVVSLEGKTIPETMKPGDKFQIELTLKIASSYHINAHVPTLEYLIATSAAFQAPAGIKIGEVKYPPSLQKKFDFSPDTPLAVLEGEVKLTASAELDGNFRTLAGAEKPIIKVRVTAQACNDSQCLAPATLKMEIPLKIEGSAAGSPTTIAPVHKPSGQIAGQSGQPAEGAVPVQAVSVPLKQFGSGSPEPQNPIAEMISNRGFAMTLLLVFLSGLALNTTPCVYPIIPITIGFFANQSEGRLSRTFLMALLYVLGMATTYSVLGVVASLTKGFFGAALQNPAVLILLALLMVGLSLSMFGLYEFRLPTFLNRLVSKSTQASSGLPGALIMGLTMGIVAAPCIGPFVLGLLVHVGTRGDPVYGFFMFFVLSLGLGLPYLFLGTFSGTISRLPRSGQWMVTIRKIFGFVLLGMALYFLAPLAGIFTRYLLALLLLVASLFFLFFEARKAKPVQFGWLLRLLGIAAFAGAVFCLLPEKKVEAIHWQPYSEAALAAASQSGRPVVIDAYADWCIPCKELDKFTFSDPAVRQQASSLVTLKLNLTRDEPGTEAAKAKLRFGIQGVPTLIFLDATGEERRTLRLEGFEKSDQFLGRLKAVQNLP